MSFDQNTQTMSVGSRDWLRASKDMQLRAYRPPVGTVDVIAEFLEQNTQVTMINYGAVVISRGYERPSLTERLNEAYRDELEPEERELLDRAAEQFGRRLSSEE